MKRKIAALIFTLMLMTTILSPLGASAATSGNTVVTGTVPASIALTAPAGLTLPSLVPGSTVESSFITVTVNSNLNGWSLTAAENGSGDGKMEKTGGVIMPAALEIQGGNITTYTPLTSTVTLRNADGTPGNIQFNNIKFRQTVAANQTAGEYTITVVFTVSGGA